MLIEAWPGLLFLSVLALSLWLPSLLLGDTASGVLIGSLILQLSGLLTAAYGLGKRGILFDRVPPWTAIWNWAGSIKRVFRKPKVVTVEVDAALTAMDGSGVGVTVSADQKTLEQRVDELEEQVERLREADRKLREEMTAKVREVRNLLTAESTQLRTELREVQAKLRIPTEVGHRFRSKWTTDSGRSGPGIPEEVDHAFRGSGPAIPADVDHLSGGVEADAG